MADYIQCYLGKKGQWKKSLLRNMMRNASYPHSMSLSMYYHLEKTVKRLEKTVGTVGEE